MPRPRRTAPVLLGLAAGLSACGGATRYADAPRPPTPIVVAAAITPDGVNISPDHFGAGPVQVVVTNLTANSQQLLLSRGSFHQQTAPINPQDTAQLKAELGAGSYKVSVSDAGVKAAVLAVGARRRTSQDQLLLP